MKIAWGTIICWIALPVALVVLLVRWLLLVAKGIGGEDCFRDCVTEAQLETAMWMFFAAVMVWCLAIAWRYWPRDLNRDPHDPPGN